VGSIQDISIRHKLTLLLVGVVGVVLLAVSAANIANIVVFTRAARATTFLSLAKVVAAESGAALSIADVDPDGAQQIVSDLSIEPSIRLAALFDDTGKVVALHPADSSHVLQPPSEPGAVYTRDGFLDVVQEVRLADGTRVGLIYLRADTRELRMRVGRTVAISVAVFVLALVATLFLSVILQRFISAPILELAQLTQRVSREHDYSLRAEKRCNDELGTLCDAFNRMMADIRDRDAELMRHRARLAEIIESAPNAIVVVNHEGHMVLANSQTERLFGYCREELLGEPIELLVPERFRGQHPGHRRKYFSNPETRPMGAGRDLFGLRKDGSEFPVEIGLSLIRSEEGLRVLSSIVDITERKRAEDEQSQIQAELAAANRDLRQKNQENETFVYSVSHDLRSPLVSLQGFSKELGMVARELQQLLLTSDVPTSVRAQAETLIAGDMQQSLRFIESGVLRLGHIIEALLRLSRVGRVEYDLRPLQTQPILERIVESIAAEVFDRGATIQLGDLPPCHGDATAVEQIFANLIGNALKYSNAARPPRIEVGALPRGTTSETAGAEPAVTYYVKDNGLGIATAHMTKIFQAFQRAHPDHAPGEGMGLAIVQRIVDRHGGRIWVESRVEEGSTFFFTLPQPKVAETTGPARDSTEGEINHGNRSVGHLASRG
jgi:PAS domain S-box-containing protein